MHWIIQDNLYNEKAYITLVRAIERNNIPHTFVKVIPFIGKITPDVNPSGNVIAVGAYSLWKVAKEKGWNPGVFVNENFNYFKFIENYGNDFLNTDARFSSFEDVEHIWDRFFIKPCKDSKVFSGCVMEWNEFNSWRKQVLELGWEGTVTPTTCVVQSPLTEIYREYRFFIVNKKVITGSQYRVGTRVFSTECHEQDVIQYAQRMADKWSPHIGYVLDIALTPNGYKVIEVNCLNASGFYACDMAKVVEALEQLY